MATIKQVSEAAGVSQATVSRVMNGSARVSTEARGRVEAAMKSLGYTPNAFAQSLASNRSNGVGLVVSELNGAYYGQLMEGLEQTLRAADKYLLIASGHSEEAREREAVEFLLSRRCDALVLHTERLTDEYLTDLATRVPVVMINRLVPALSEYSIYLDNQEGGYQATQHLIAQHRHRIGCITGPARKLDAMQRQQGYEQALQDAGLELDPRRLIAGDFTVESGRQAARQLLQQTTDIDGLVVGDDDMAIGAMAELLQAGYRIPEDIAVIGFDDVPYARYMSPPLSSMYLPIREMAVMAARQVLHRVYRQSAELHNRFTAELRPRASSNR